MRLLLAEDEEAVSKAMVTILKHNNYAVDAVFDGQQALDYLECGFYDGLILDLMMPKVDGITVLKTIRRKGNKIPVLILTAKSEVDDKVFGLDCGADDYLTKPFVTKELLARIRPMTRRQSDLQDNALVYGDLRLDRTSFELISQKGELLLTAKEFQIMEMFMMNPKCILSAEQLMDRVWGLESETEISVVWTYISYLRKKLKTLDSSVTIRAVRNVGYTLEVPDA